MYIYTERIGLYSFVVWRLVAYNMYTSQKLWMSWPLIPLLPLRLLLLLRIGRTPYTRSYQEPDALWIIYLHFKKGTNTNVRQSKSLHIFILIDLKLFSLCLELKILPTQWHGVSLSPRHTIRWHLESSLPNLPRTTFKILGSHPSGGGTPIFFVPRRLSFEVRCTWLD
jgi:hypothetical protein